MNLFENNHKIYNKKTINNVLMSLSDLSNMG